jgi:predicted PurR-regulated permease PerM
MTEDLITARRIREALPIFVALATILFALALGMLLYLGRDVFVPFALAILLSFVLAPAVRILQQAGMPRGAAALIAVLIAVAGVGGLGAVVGQQVAQLATDVPKYEATIKHKITSIRTFVSGTGDFANAVETLKGLAQDGLAAAPAPPGQPQARGGRGRPMPVEVVSDGSGSFGDLMTVAAPLLHPLATFGVIVVFAVFVLIQREDLRNRLIRLAGTDDLLKTTAAIDDAAHRLSRLFLMQLAINSVYGVIIGVGLWLVGLPSPVLWGVLAAVLRFIPYVGATMGAAFPLLLAVAIDPGWSMLLWAGALILVVDVILGQGLEPLLYGHSTGISPVAVILTTAMWTFLWGPIGLILAGPLTVCVVVLGRHVERLRFLDILLGDRPVLAPHEIFYQRMLAGDPQEAAEKAREILKERALVTYYDEVALEGMRLAQQDAGRGALTRERQETVRAAIKGLVRHLEIQPGTPGTATNAEAAAAVEAVGPDAEIASIVRRPEQLRPEWRGPSPVLCIAGRGPLDEGIALMLAQLFDKHGLHTRVIGPEALAAQPPSDADLAGVAMVCFSFVEPLSAAHVRLAARRIRQRVPGLRVMVGIWGRRDPVFAQDLRRATSADVLATSLREALTGALRLSAPEEPALLG